MTTQLTGRLYHKQVNRLFRKPELVLMVEVHSKGEYVSGTDAVGKPYDTKYWREGTTLDLVELRGMQRSKLNTIHKSDSKTQALEKALAMLTASIDQIEEYSDNEIIISDVGSYPISDVKQFMKDNL